MEQSFKYHIDRKYKKTPDKMKVSSRQVFFHIAYNGAAAARKNCLPF